MRRAVRSYLCSNVTVQCTTGLTQDQHTNSGRRLPFVLLPSFYLQEIIWRKNHVAGPAVKRDKLHSDFRHVMGGPVHAKSLVPALLTATRTAVCNVTPRSFSVINVSKNPLPSSSLIPRIVTQTGHNLNHWRAGCHLRQVSEQPMKHLVTQNHSLRSLTTSPQPLPKPVLHTARSSASSFNF